jgi:hypothetical protein
MKILGTETRKQRVIIMLELQENRLVKEHDHRRS